MSDTDITVGDVRYSPDYESKASRRGETTLYTVTGDIRAPKPGEKCALCERPVRRPKKESSPASAPISFRPKDDDTFTDDLERALNIVGLTSEHKYRRYKFFRFLIDVVFADEDWWRGSYLREYSGESPHQPEYEVPDRAELETQGLA